MGVGTSGEVRVKFTLTRTVELSSPRLVLAGVGVSDAELVRLTLRLRLTSDAHVEDGVDVDTFEQ